MFKVSPCFPRKTKDTYASTDSSMTSMTMSLYNTKIQHNQNLKKDGCKTKNISPFKNSNSIFKIEKIERKSAPKTKSYFNGSFFKENFCHIEGQNVSKKSKNEFRINVKKHSLDFMIQDKRKKLRQQKHESVPQVLKSSNLSDIYSRLYETYQSVPFVQSDIQEQMIANQEKTIKDISKLEQIQRKIKKQFEVKELTWQKNLRKEIKSLTKDTDNILSLEFRDIRDVRR